ncbi:hypothetical protein BpHYR1_003633 [Brachionus plicatilis]|uniref:Uncharacterized protein n=1 Tax=Brachionus plicatilis TaxID=10195 RepID=A0A3M7PDC8_BRAPC|nr:hypothetical protein BpHYR1_003633 [Brachionus plicatilis]
MRCGNIVPYIDGIKFSILKHEDQNTKNNYFTYETKLIHLNKLLYLNLNDSPSKFLFTLHEVLSFVIHCKIYMNKIHNLIYHTELHTYDFIQVSSQLSMPKIYEHNISFQHFLCINLDKAGFPSKINSKKWRRAMSSDKHFIPLKYQYLLKKNYSFDFPVYSIWEPNDLDENKCLFILEMKT